MDLIQSFSADKLLDHTDVLGLPDGLEEIEVAPLSSADMVFLEGGSAPLEVTLLRGGVFAKELKSRDNFKVSQSSGWELVKFSRRLTLSRM